MERSERKNPEDFRLIHSVLALWILRGVCPERSRRDQKDTLSLGKDVQCYPISFQLTHDPLAHARAHPSSNCQNDPSFGYNP